MIKYCRGTNITSYNFMFLIIIDSSCSPINSIEISSTIVSNSYSNESSSLRLLDRPKVMCGIYLIDFLK